MKQKYTHYKRVRVMDYDSQQKYAPTLSRSNAEEGTLSLESSNVSKTADTFYFQLNEQEQEQLEKNHPRVARLIQMASEHPDCAYARMQRGER